MASAAYWSCQLPLHRRLQRHPSTNSHGHQGIQQLPPSHADEHQQGPDTSACSHLSEPFFAEIRPLSLICLQGPCRTSRCVADLKKHLAYGRKGRGENRFRRMPSFCPTYSSMRSMGFTVVTFSPPVASCRVAATPKIIHTGHDLLIGKFRSPFRIPRW